MMLLFSLRWKGWIFFKEWITEGGKTDVEAEEAWGQITVYRKTFIGHYTSKHIFAEAKRNWDAIYVERMRPF